MKPTAFLFLGALAALLTAASSASSAAAPPLPLPAPDMATYFGASHWSPCYYINKSLPSLLDGAAALARTGSRAIKVPLSAAAFPWNSPLWPPAGFPSLAATAAHPYFAALLSSPSFQTLVLVAYAVNQGDICGNYTAADAANDVTQFAALTSHLFAAYSGSGKRIVLQSWENDWAARCGSYNASRPADPRVQENMVRWLQARQDGVSAGRAAACAAAAAAPSGACAGGGAQRAFMAAAGLEVYHAAEVNLVRAAMAGAPNNILRVVPRVALDMVSYSSYDTMNTRELGAALDFIADHHNRTASAPSPAVAIGEFGTPEMVSAPGAVAHGVSNVLAYALSAGAGASNAGLRRAAYVMAWETMDNEVRGEDHDRCSAATGPEFNVSHLNGFWLVRPDGSEAYTFEAMRGYINGSLPLPAPPSGAACTFAQDTDVSGVQGSSVSIGGAGQAAWAACCALCNAAPASCGAAVFFEGTCYLKDFGGSLVHNPGRVACVPS